MKKRALFILAIFLVMVLGLFLFLVNPVGTKTLVLSTIYPNNPKYSPFACAKNNGRWVKVRPPAGYGDFCYYPPSDEGKFCYEDGECEIHCITNMETDGDGYYIGKCGKYSVLDCRPHIPTKTREKQRLQSGACV